MSVSRTAQVERQLHGVALDAGHAVGAALGIDRRRQLAVPSSSTERGEPTAGPVGIVEHVSNYPAAPAAARRLGRWTESVPRTKRTMAEPRPESPSERAALSTDLRLGPQPNCLEPCRRATMRSMSITSRLASRRPVSPVPPLSPSPPARRRPPRARRRRPRRSPPPRPSPATSPSGTSSPAASKPCTTSTCVRACPGLIASVHFTEGAVVQRGDVLFEIDPRPFQAEVDRLRADLARAKAAFAAHHRRTRARPAGSRPRTRCPPRSTTAASSSAAEAEAQVSAVEAALRAAELNLEFTRVIAPIGGRVGRAIVTEGNLVSSGPGEATLLDDAGVARSDLRLVRGGRAVVPRVPARRGRRAARAGRRGPGRHPHGARRRGGLPARGTPAVPRQPARCRRPAPSACARCSPTPTAR